jgi:hypothetical protein
MKRHLLVAVSFLMIVAAYTHRQLAEGVPLADAVPYGIGYGVLWFIITGAAFCTAWLIVRPDHHNYRHLFGGRNEPRQTRRV